MKRKAARNSYSITKCAFLAIVALAIVLSIPASTFVTKRNEFYADLTVEGWKNESALGYEVWINQVQLDNVTIDIASLANDGWEYNAEKKAIWSCASENQPSSTLRIGPYDGVQSIRLSFDSHQWCGVVRVDTPVQTYTEDLYAAESTLKSCYFENSAGIVNWAGMNVQDYLLMGGGYTMLFLSCYALLMLLPLKESALLTICYVAASVVLWLTSDLIQPARSTLLFLGALSGYACWTMMKHKDSSELKGYRTVGMTCFVTIVSLYASFASFGYRLFLAGSYVTFGRERIIYLLLGTIWFFPLVLTILLILEKLGCSTSHNSLDRKKISNLSVWIITSLIALACLTVSYIGFYPGCYPLDAVVQLEQARTNIYTNWHPVIHTLLMKMILSITGKASCVVYTQLMVFAVLIGRVAIIPYEYGVKLKNILIAVTVFALLPNQAVTNISPLKDFPFSYVLVWGMLLLFEVMLNPLKLRKPSILIQMTLCMYLMKELRHNGIFPLAFLILVLVFVAYKYRKLIKYRVIACILAALIAIGVTDGPIFTALNVAENPITPYVTMFCGVGSCLNKGKSFSDETMARLEDVMSLDNWINYYGRFVGHDRYLWGGGENRMDLSSFGAIEAFKIYFEALTTYPDIVIKDRMDGMNIMWDVSQPDDEGNFNARVFDIIVANDNLGLSDAGIEDGTTYYVHTPIADFYRDWTYFSFEGERTEDQVTDMLLWRSGAYLIFFLILAIYWTKHRLYRMWGAAMPMLGNIAAMVLVLYHQSFRYIYFIQLCVLTLALMTFLMQRKQQENTNNAIAENV